MTKFKTTLLAMAVSAAAFSVQAAQVSLYGSVSTGVLYQNQASLSGDQDAANQESKDSFTMESGFWGDSIWGITGEEDLGNGWTVGFTLENEFGSDTGEMASEGTIFDSQAYLRIGNDKVNFAFGNIGGLASAGGDFDLICGFDPMEAFVGVAGLGAFASKDFASGNMAVVEVTPMEGFKVSLMGNTGDKDSNAKWSDRDHYYGLGVSYENGPLALAAIAEMRKYDRLADWVPTLTTMTPGPLRWPPHTTLKLFVRALCTSTPARRANLRQEISQRTLITSTVSCSAPRLRLDRARCALPFSTSRVKTMRCPTKRAVPRFSAWPIPMT